MEMMIKNAKVLIGKSFVETDIAFDKTITAIGKADEESGMDGRNCYVVPGLVDIHTHGAVGGDFSDGKPDDLQPMADFYAAHGVTSFLATAMTLKEEALISAMHAIRDFRTVSGAKCAGIHLEGPFLGYARRGAQTAEFLHEPDIALFHRLNAAGGGSVKMVTVACEEEGAMPFIREVSRVCTVSLGHTTADYGAAMAAFAAGASHVTHLFNGMLPFLHRAPGVIGAAFDAGVSVELICDGLHIHPAAIRAAYRLFGDKVNLISDSIRCAGMPDGSYELGGQPVVMKNGRAALPDGTLAGSSISLLDAVRRAVRFGLPLASAVYAASTAPALAVGLDAGVLRVGRPADLLVLDEKLAVKAVFVDGRAQNICP